MADPSPYVPETVETCDFDLQFVPDNSAVETLLTPADDGSLPDVHALLKNPQYQQAFAEFAKENENIQSIVDTSELSDSELADLVNNNSDINDEFWRFYEQCKNLKDNQNE